MKFRVTRTTPVGTFGSRHEAETLQQARSFAQSFLMPGVKVTIEHLQFGSWTVLDVLKG